MERLMGGRSDHGVVSHYSLSRPEFEDRSSDRGDGDRVFGQSRQSRRLTEFNEGFCRGNPTSSKFQWEQLFAQSKELGSAGSCGSAATTDGSGGVLKPSRIGVTLPNMPMSVESERGRFSAPCHLDVGVPRDSGNVSGRVLDSSQFGITLPAATIPVSVEPESGRFSGSCHLDVAVPQHSDNVYGCGIALPSTVMTRGTQMDEEFGSQKTQKPARLDNLDVYFKAASVYNILGSLLKEFEMAFQKDAIREGLHVPSYGSGSSPKDFGLCGLDVRSTESHVDPPSMQSNDMKSNPLVDPPSMQSNDMKSNPLVDPRSMRSSDVKSKPPVDARSMRSSERRISPLGDFSSNEGKHVNYNHKEDQKMARGIISKMYDKFCGSMPGLEEHTGPGIVSASSGDQTVDRIDECSPRVQLKSPRLGDHVSPLKEQSNAHYVPASGSPHPKVQGREVRGHGSALLKDQDAYKKHGRLLTANEHGLEKKSLEMLPVTRNDACLDQADGRNEQQRKRERSEMLPVTNSDSCFDGVDGTLQQQLPTGDSLGNLLKRKDGNRDPQKTTEDEQHFFVSKKTRWSLLQDENLSKSSNERALQRTANSDTHVSQLIKSGGIDSGNINKCLESCPQNIIATKTSPSKQSPSVAKRLIPSPQKTNATHSSVKRQKHSITKQLGPTPKIVQAKKQSGPAPEIVQTKKQLVPAPEIVKPSEPVLQNHNVVSFAKRLCDDPDGRDDPDGAHGQERDSLEDNSIPAKIEQPHVPSQAKNQIPGKVTNRSQDGPNGGHNQVVDSSNGYATPAKSKPPHVPPPKMKSHMPNNVNKGCQNGLDGAPSQEGNFSKGNTPVKSEPPQRVKKTEVGKFTKRIQDGPDGACSQEGNSKESNATPVKTEPPHTPGPMVKKKKTGTITSRLGDGPVSSTDKATPTKSDTLRVSSPVVNNQNPGEPDRADLCGAHVQKEDSLHGNVTLVKTVPHETSKDFKQRVHSAFLKFVKQLNENSAQWRNVLEQGKAGRLKCNICGSNSEEFVDMKTLVLHTFTSPTVSCRALHLGYHKALCLMMGWKCSMAFDSSWICETLPDAEASALKEDLIIWPPVAIIHNGSIQNSNPDERVVVTTEILKAFLKDMGFGEKTKVGWGKPGDQSVMVVKFSGTLSGFQEAERLHSFYAKKKHGRVEYQHFADGKNCTTWHSNPPAAKLEHVLYGYLGVAEDLDKLDFETKKRCLVKSKRDIQSIADAF